MYKLKFYTKSIFEHLLIPDFVFRVRLPNFLAKADKKDVINAFKRVNYYFKRDTFFDLDDVDTETLSSLSCFDKSAYYYDIRSTLRHFPKESRFDCWLRDVITVPNNPCFVKCRPIGKFNDNSAILKLNQVRHYRKICDNSTFSKKESKIVWRGSVFQRSWRAKFIKKLIDNPFCNIGAVKGTGGILDNRFEKEYLPISEQLKYKFIFSIEGADVATNLKWIAQSNSLCFMKKPTHESWFMENLLIPDYHYVLVDETLDDIDDKIQYYLEYPDKAEKIISNMKKFYSQFEDSSNEILVSLLVVMKYLYLSGQLSFKDFDLGYIEGEFLGSN
jgi:hypothetical protein